MSFNLITVIITTFNDDKYLDSLLFDISRQDLNSVSLEILILEAGSYEKQRAKRKLKNLGQYLRFFHEPNLGRSQSLNKLMNESKGDLVIRLDARSHIQPDYIKRIINLSKSTDAANVGGVMIPVGKSGDQKLIAEIMKHPICFGGANFRNEKYVGEVRSVYLGAINKNKIKLNYWYDRNNKISEDSDLNYRINLMGGKVVLDSGIKVYYYPREDILSFLSLSFNYGVGRGLFVIKHKKFSAIRQMIPPAFFTVILILFFCGYYNQVFFICLSLIILIYISTLSIIALTRTRKIFDFIKFLTAIIGCHFFWSLGLLSSPFYFKNRY